MNHTILKEYIKQEVLKILKETPIGDFERIGDFDKSSSIKNPIDRALLNSPKAEIKIRKIWQNTPGNYNLVFINDPRVNKPEFREVGEVSEDFVRNKMKISKEELQIDPNATTIIYTNNTGDERVMATGWILAHRLAHAVRYRNKNWTDFTKRLHDIFKDMILDVYNINVQTYSQVLWKNDEEILKFAAQTLGTMKSARDANLRNWYEFAYELFAQYFLTGNITFNKIPDNIVIGNLPFGRKNLRKVNSKESQEMYNRHDLEYYAEELDSLLSSVVYDLKGKIFVM